MDKSFDIDITIGDFLFSNRYMSGKKIIVETVPFSK